MKSNILKLSSLLLFLLSIWTGCKDDDPDYDPDSIIGKWELLYTSGGFAGTTYPKAGNAETIEFTEDRVLIVKVNGEINFETNYNVSGDTLKYHRGTDLEYKIEISGDTLALTFIEWGLNPFYKRIE